MFGPGRHRLPLQTSQMQWKALVIGLLPLSAPPHKWAPPYRFLLGWSLHFHNTVHVKLGMASCEDAQANKYVNIYTPNCKPGSTCLCHTDNPATFDVVLFQLWHSHLRLWHFIQGSVDAHGNAYLIHTHFRKHKNTLSRRNSLRVKSVG